MRPTLHTLPSPGSALLAMVQDRIMHRSQQQLRIAHAMARRMHATEALAARLHESGFIALAQADDDDSGIPFPIVIVAGDSPRIIDWLAHHAVPVDEIYRSPTLQIRSCSAQVNGQTVSVVIQHREDSHGS